MEFTWLTQVVTYIYLPVFAGRVGRGIVFVPPFSKKKYLSDQNLKFNHYRSFLCHHSGCDQLLSGNVAELYRMILSPRLQS